MEHKGEGFQPTITPTMIRIAEKFDKLSLDGKLQILTFILSLENGVDQQFDQALLLFRKSA